MSKQFGDDGAVIGYRPHLEYNKEIDNKPEVVTKPTSGASDYSGKQLSNALSDFSSMPPSSALSVLDDALVDIKNTIGELAQSFNGVKNTDYGSISALLSALSSGNKEFADAFIDYHFNEISGSHIPEIISELDELKNRLEILGKTYKELFYGDENIETEQAKEIDDANLNRLQTYESVGAVEKINYVAVAMDNMLNQSTKIYGHAAMGCVTCLRDIFIKKDSNNVSPERMPTIKKLFDEVNDEISYRKQSYDEKQSVEIMQKTLYNYYNKRSELITLYGMFSESRESIMIGTHIQKKQKELLEAIEEVNRAYLGNKFHIEEIAKLEQEKHYLRDIYAGFNYNSAN